VGKVSYDLLIAIIFCVRRFRARE